MLSIKQNVTELDIFQPKSPSESGESGKSGVPKKSKDKSMLNNFKDFLHSKLKKHGERKQQQGDCDVFHGFSDEEIRSASANDSSSERSSIISSLSREEKDERKKKRKSEAAAAAAAARCSGMSGETFGVPLLHRSLIVEGKRPKKPSAKIQELAQVRYFW